MSRGEESARATTETAQQVEAAAETHDDEEAQRQYFEANVRKQLNSEGLLFPVCVDKELQAAYNWKSKKWVRLPPLSFLPKNLLDAAHIPLRGGGGDAGLAFVTKAGSNDEDCIIVANLFTQKWRLLPPRPGLLREDPAVTAWQGDTLSDFLPVKLFRDPSTGSYKVIAFSLQLSRFKPLAWFANVYDSRIKKWNITTLLIESGLRPRNCVYLNGVVYMVTKSGIEYLYTINTEDGSTKMLDLSYTHLPSEAAKNELVVCNGELIMLVSTRSSNKIWILKVHTETLQLLVINRGSPDSFLDDDSRISVRRASSHGSYIFFKKENFMSPMVAYNLLKDEWSRLEYNPLILSARLTSLSQLESAIDFEITDRRCQDVTFEAGFDPFWRV